MKRRGFWRLDFKEFIPDDYSRINNWDFWFHLRSNLHLGILVGLTGVVKFGNVLLGHFCPIIFVLEANKHLEFGLITTIFF
ncbi:hypothetical protein GGC63_005563 [Paenibacillus sp. OAS669]|nr:hypothetical protein [Paenibacillus sp. OAS669]